MSSSEDLSFRFFARSKPWIRALKTASWRVLFLLVLTIINPFGVMTFSDDVSREVWQDVYAEGYLERARGTGETAADTTDPYGRKDITVLLVGEAGMDYLTSGRQADSLDFADLVANVSSVTNVLGPGRKPPKAIFLDFGMGHLAPEGELAKGMTVWSQTERDRCEGGRTAEPPSEFRCMVYLLSKITAFANWENDPNCQANPLAKLACIQSSGGVPIIFADLRSPNRPPQQREDDGYAALGRIGILSPVTYKDAAIYPLVKPENARERSAGRFDLTPAAILFAAHCWPDREDERGPCKSPPFRMATHRASDGMVKSLLPSWRKQYSRPVEVIWGIGSATTYDLDMTAMTGEEYDAHCRPAEGKGSEILAISRHFFSGIVSEETNRCIYSRSMTFEQLGAVPDPIVEAAFEDKIVLVGLTAGTADFIEAPAAGRVSGVYLHAMALDNLLVSGAGYQKPARPIIAGWLRFSDQDGRNLFALFWIILVVSIGTIYVSRRNHRLFVTTPERARLERGERLWLLFRDSAIRFGVLATCLLIGALLLISLTGQAKVIPKQYNYAALTILIAFEIFNLLKAILNPVGVKLMRWGRRLRRAVAKEVRSL